MKLHTTLLIVLSLTNINCTSQKKLEYKNNDLTLKQTKPIEKIELREQTRGTNRIFTFEPASLNISLNGNSNKTELSPADWKNMTQQASFIDLSKISTFEAPTTGRYSDSALSSTIIITSAGKTYTSPSFDAGIPPKELEGLYQLLRGKPQIIKKN